MKSKQKSKAKWFVPTRGSYLPSSGWGWASYIPFTAFLVVTLLLTDKINASVATRIYLIIVQWSFAGFAMTWLARRKS